MTENTYCKLQGLLAEMKCLESCKFAASNAVLNLLIEVTETLCKEYEEG